MKMITNKMCKHCPKSQHNGHRLRHRFGQALAADNGGVLAGCRLIGC